MATLANLALTNSQPLTARAWTRGRRGSLVRFTATLQLWRQRIRERRALARLGPRELADIGASTADVYRELSTPFWRSQPPC